MTAARIFSFEKANIFFPQIEPPKRLRNYSLHCRKIAGSKPNRNDFSGVFCDYKSEIYRYLR